MFSINGVLYRPQTVSHGVALIKAPRKRSPSPGQLNLLDATKYTAPPPKAMRVGQRKVDDQGRIYELNQNRRWSRVGEQMKQPTVGGLGIINADAEGGLRSRRATTWSGAPSDPTPRPRYSDYARRPYIPPKVSSEGVLRPREESVEAIAPTKIQRFFSFKDKAEIPLKAVDWGRRDRKAGKRNGGMIMGAMGADISGIRHYKDYENAPGMTPELWEEVRLFEDEEKAAIIGMIQSGISPHEALVLAYTYLEEEDADVPEDLPPAPQLPIEPQVPTESGKVDGSTSPATLKKERLTSAQLKEMNQSIKQTLRDADAASSVEEMRQWTNQSSRFAQDIENTIKNGSSSKQNQGLFDQVKAQSDRLKQKIDDVKSRVDRQSTGELPSPDKGELRPREEPGEALESLFLDADRIGNKYQSEEERAKFQEQLNQEVEAIADATDRLFPDEPEPAPVAAPTPRRPLPARPNIADPTSKEAIAARLERMRRKPEAIAPGEGELRPREVNPLDSATPQQLAGEIEKHERFLAQADAGLAKLTPRSRKQRENYIKELKGRLFEMTDPGSSDNISDEDLLRELTEPEPVEVEVVQEVKSPGLVSDLKNLVTELKESRAEKIKAISGIMGASTKLAQNYDKLVDEISDMVHEDLGVPREPSESTPVTVRAGGNTDTPEPPKPLGDRIRAIASQLREEQSTQARGVSRVLGAAAAIASRYDDLVDEAAAMTRADLDAKAIASTPDQGPLRLRESDGPKEGDRKAKVVSRKQVQSHISSKSNLKHLDLDVFTVGSGEGLRIVGRGGIDKTFSSNQAAKAWVTKLDNQELYRRVNARLDT